MSARPREMPSPESSPRIAGPYLLFLADAPDRLTAKTAIGVHHWRGDRCLGQFRLPGCQVDLGLPELDPAAAFLLGARTLIVGLAPAGGDLPQPWVGAIVQAINAGLDIASGLHVRLRNIPAVVAAAGAAGRALIDVRDPATDFPVASYRKRSGKRLLTVGTDCAVGKMFTALAVEAELRRRGIAADFRATGQTGILIAGSGAPIDAVVSDFVAGAAESLSPDAADDHWDLIEGQGALVHPSYAGVSLGLLHGSQPDAIIICHEADRRANADFADLPLPPLREAADLNLQLGRLTNPGIALVGCSLNTSRLSPAAAMDAIARAEDELGVPAADPVRTGVGAIVDRLLGLSA